MQEWTFLKTVESSVSNFHPTTTLPEASKQSALDNSAYVFLALGAQANQMNCPAAVESLVRFGGWGGDVYIITDRENCFDGDQIVKNAGMKSENFHLQVVNEDFGGGGIDFTHPKIGSRKNRVRSFAMKARLFDVIPDPKIQTIAYVDCDILFAIDGCAKDFITDGPSWEENKIRFSHLFYNKDGTNSNEFIGLHAGTMVAHREHSKEVLKIWREEIEKGLSEGDNDAYMDAYNQLQKDIISNNNHPSATNQSATIASAIGVQPNSKLVRNIMLPGEIVKHGDPSKQINWYEKFINPLNHTALYCMNHIPKARCATYGREAIQSFVDRFDLRTYRSTGGSVSKIRSSPSNSNNYPYCTHSILQPLLYGWFPFSYLPFCPKMEQYL